MNNISLRKCKVKKVSSNGDMEVIFGMFHQWGCSFEEFDTGPANYTTAIVELPDGSIIEPVPQFVKFLPDDFEMPGWEGTKYAD